MLKILCIGPQFRGSNAGGLFRALIRIGNIVEIIDENYYINLSSKSFLPKALDKLLRNVYIKEFNNTILRQASLFKPDIILVYKGAFITPDTLLRLKESNHRLVNFYPDVSFWTHGPWLPKTLPLYDHVFTTKTFGVQDMYNQLKISNASFIPHGFDPEIHRPIDIATLDTSTYECDVSFIGGYSEKKANLLNMIRKRLPHIQIKIWGERWNNCVLPELQESIMKKSIVGDLYSIGILSSKINLAILHEKVKGASSGDQITSRTFHIPGAGGFMIHEMTSESVLYFKEDTEAVFFSEENELIEKINYYLNNHKERQQIQKQGHQRALRDHSLDKRAEMVIEKLKALL